MSEWSDGSLINKEVIDSLTPEQLEKLRQMLEKVK